MIAGLLFTQILCERFAAKGFVLYFHLMTTLKVIIENEASAELLGKLLRAMSFVLDVEKQADDEALDAETLALLESRLAAHDADPDSGKSIEALTEEMKSKYGF